MCFQARKYSVCWSLLYLFSCLYPLRFKNAALDTHLSGLSVWDNEVVIFVSCMMTGPNGAVVMSSANGLVGTGFASRYRLQPRVGF